MYDLNDFRLFAYVVEEGGFAAAGRRLGMPRSFVSRRIQVLEDALGIRLLQRTPRSFQISELGQEFYRRCLAMIAEADAAAAVIETSRHEPVGTLRIACPSSLIQYQLAGMVTRYMQKYPKVTISLESTSRRVDLLREGFDLAVRMRFPPLEDSDLIVRRFETDAQYLVASPGCLGQHGDDAGLDVVSRLAQLPSLSWNPDDSRHLWNLLGPEGKTLSISYQPRLLTQDMAALLEAVLAGLGVAQLPAAVAVPHLRSGQLVEVLPGWRPRAGIVHAVFASRRGRSPTLVTFLDFVEAEFRQAAKACLE